MTYYFICFQGGKKVLYVPSTEEAENGKKKRKQDKTITSIGDLQFTTYHSIWSDGSKGPTLYIASGKRIPKDFDINDVEEGAFLAISENGGMTEEIWNGVTSIDSRFLT